MKSAPSQTTTESALVSVNNNPNGQAKATVARGIELRIGVLETEVNDMQLDIETAMEEIDHLRDLLDLIDTLPEEGPREPVRQQRPSSPIPDPMDRYYPRLAILEQIPRLVHWMRECPATENDGWTCSGESHACGYFMGSGRCALLPENEGGTR